MNILEQYGWNEFFHTFHINNQINSNFLIGRVISVKGFKFHLVSTEGEISAELSGKLLYGTETWQLPGVGDWVYFVRYDSQGYIVDLFLRQNALSRRNPGKASDKQILAANVDYALIVQGLDRDFNIMRLDRYIVQISSCGINPVVVLNKVDLVTDRQWYLNEVLRLARNCPVCLCNTIDESGMNEFYSTALHPGKTHILIGSSGVGKSSMLNRLNMDIRLKTSCISESTNKGRHTTTSRELFLLPDGSMLIDTPGMREFGIALDEDISSSGLFPAIDELAVHCRYDDCMHTDEAGCSVLEALNSGHLDQKVYSSYIKLVKEQTHFEIKVEDKKRLGKQFGKIMKDYKNFKNKYDY